jgi:hypothetical protein
LTRGGIVTHARGRRIAKTSRNADTNADYVPRNRCLSSALLASAQLTERARGRRFVPRLQQLFFPDGVRFDGRRIVGTGTTLPVFNCLSSVSEQKRELVDHTGVEPSSGMRPPDASPAVIRTAAPPAG